MMAKKKRSQFREIIVSSLWQSRLGIVSVATCVLLGTALTLAAPWPLKLLFDHVLLGRPVPADLPIVSRWIVPGEAASVAWLAFAVVILALLSALCTYYQIYVTSRIGLEIVHRLRHALFAHLQRMSPSFYAKTHSGELMSKLVSDTNTLRDVYSEYLVASVTHVLTIIGICVVMLMIDAQLALLVLLTFPLLFCALIVILRTVRASARRQRTKETALMSRLSEVLAAIPLVQAYCREAYETEKFAQSSSQSKQESIQTARSEAAAARLVEVVRAVGTAMMMMIGGVQVLRGRITPGDLLVFSTYIVNLYKPVRVLARLTARLFKASASAERVREILNAEPEIQDEPNAIRAENLRGEIVFEDVSFGYQSGSPVLHRLSFTIAPGKCVALVGASGAGKSTIANLLVRFYDPTSGRVMIDGVDLKSYERQSIRQQIGVVLQDTLLFGASIAENIAYGKPDATRAEIEAAARHSLAHEFITHLPDGYDTIIGEGGASLSGGQRQRIGLARALIKAPAILLMDEPTSAVDHEAEQQIRGQLRKMREDKTTILIAHKLQSVMDADLILVLKDGQLVERGTHEHLVRRGGYYCELFQIEIPEAAVQNASRSALALERRL